MANLFSFVSMFVAGIDGVIASGTKILRNIKESISHINDLKKGHLPKEGRETDRRIREVNHQAVQVIIDCQDEIQAISRSKAALLRSPIVQNVLDINPYVARDLVHDPERMGIIDVQNLIDVRSMNYYTPSGIHRPMIFPDSNGNNLIGFIPMPVFRANFTYPWETPLDMNRFSAFGITSMDIMPEVSTWFDMLGVHDQLYFSQLYRDYHQFAKSVGQRDIPTPTDFVQELYTKRDRIMRETGAKMVSFAINTDTIDSRIRRVYVKPIAIQR